MRDFSTDSPAIIIIVAAAESFPELELGEPELGANLGRRKTRARKFPQLCYTSIPNTQLAYNSSAPINKPQFVVVVVVYLLRAPLSFPEMERVSRAAQPRPAAVARARAGGICAPSTKSGAH